MDNKQIRTKYRNKINAFELSSIIILVVIYAVILALNIVYFDISNVSKVINSIVSSISLVFIILLFGFCLGGFTWNEREKRFFEWIIIIFYFISVLQMINSLVPYSNGTLKLHFILDNSFYVSASVFWVCIWMFQKDKFESRFNKKYVELFIVIFFSVFSIFAIINMFTEFDFAYKGNGEVLIKHYFLSVFSVAWYIIYAVIILFGKSDKKTKLTFLSYSFFPLISYVLMLVLQNDSFYLMVSVNINIILYLIPLYLIFFNVYMERGKILLMNEMELEKSRANVMALQINPHFIANTMSSIVALCEPNAPEASSLASKFANYLRDNYVNMSSEQLIPITTEIQHVKNYLEVEKVRFPNIKDEYDIKCDNFLVPTLTVQTLVENAVRHGIQKKKNASGTVVIKAYDDENCFIVEIIDDGVGIDNEKLDNNRIHVGIKNVKSRLSLLCDGLLEINSKQGIGTTCKISIPKK